MRETPKLSCKALFKVHGDGAAIGHVFGAENFPPDDNAFKRFGLVGAVQHVFLDIHEGETFGIVGLPGAGKSTLLRLLAGLIRPSFGEIFLDGQNLLKMRARELIALRRRKMGMVFQEFALLPHLTVLQNVAFALSLQGVKRGPAESRAAGMVGLLGLKGCEGRYPRELSDAQQQRVGIARALVAEPEIWFLDAPFSALDPLNRHEMQGEFLRLQGLMRKTAVFTTGEMGEAVRLADRIAVMRGGRILQVASPEALMLEPADEHVRELTRDVPRDKVVSVGAIMQPGATGKGPGIEASQKVAEVAQAVIAAGAPVMVCRDGRPVGAVEAEAVIRVLVGPRE